MRIVGCTHSRTYRPESYISLQAFGAQAVREAPMKKGALYLGIAQLAIAPPTLHSNKHTGGTLFPGGFELVPFELHFSLHKCPKPFWQGFSTPKKKQMPL